MGEVDSEARILNADALRHVKKAFQILWGAARFIEHLCAVSNSPALRKSCLDIQSEAIHFVLRSLKKVFHHSPYLLSEERAPSAGKEIRALFDRASSLAKKSVGAFKNASRSNPSMEIALIHFHGFVGT